MLLRILNGRYLVVISLDPEGRLVGRSERFAPGTVSHRRVGDPKPPLMAGSYRVQISHAFIVSL
jgi:hypothetical protein